MADPTPLRVPPAWSQPHQGLMIASRERPANLPAEQALLGAILANNIAFNSVAGFLKPEHFADPVNGAIYEAIARVILAGRQADAVTLKAEFEHSGKLAEVGGVAYLSTLLVAMVSIGSAAEYGRTVLDAYVRRRLIEAGEVIVERAFGAIDPEMAAEDQVGAAEELLIALSQNQGADRAAVPIQAGLTAVIEAAEAAYRGEGKSAPITGIGPLDEVFSEWWPQELKILGGRPGSGKSSLAIQIGRILAGQGIGVIMASMEMSAGDVARVMLAQETGISSQDLRRGYIHGQRGAALALAQKRLDGLPFVVDDKPPAGLAALMIRARIEARKLARAGTPCGLLIVDHVQKLAVDAPGNDRSGQAVQVGRITSGLKNLAKTLNVAVLALSQMRRDSETRENKRPTKADLMYAGEADADVIALLYRPEVGMAKNPPRRAKGMSDAAFQVVLDDHNFQLDQVRGLAELIGAKARFGAEVDVELTFDGPAQRFSERRPGATYGGESARSWAEPSS